MVDLKITGLANGKIQGKFTSGQLICGAAPNSLHPQNTAKEHSGECSAKGGVSLLGQK